jgi:hypothetical protein
LIDTSNASWTGITGSGTIDGQAIFAFVDYYSPEQNQFEPKTWVGVNGCKGECRPKLVRFVDSSHLFLSGVNLHNSPDWTMLFRRCSFVSIDSISVIGDTRWANNDGIDIESGSFFSITNSHFNTGDDGIVLVSGSTNVLRYPWVGEVEPTSFVYVRNCTVRSFSSALKLEAIANNTDHKAVENIIFENITVFDSNRGICFQQRSGSGWFQNVVFKDINIETRYVTGTNWWGSGEPIWLSTLADKTGNLSGSIRNVFFSNINIRSENGVLISNLADNPFSDIVFHDISLEITVLANTTCTKGAAGQEPTGCKDYRPINDPVPQIEFGKTAGFAFEGTGSVKMESVNIQFTPLQDEAYPSYWGSNIEVSGQWDGVTPSLAPTTRV